MTRPSKTVSPSTITRKYVRSTAIMLTCTFTPSGIVGNPTGVSKTSGVAVRLPRSSNTDVGAGVPPATDAEGSSKTSIIAGAVALACAPIWITRCTPHTEKPANKSASPIPARSATIKPRNGGRLDGALGAGRPRAPGGRGCRSRWRTCSTSAKPNRMASASRSKNAA